MIMTRKADKSTIHSKYLQDYCQPLKPETRAVIVHLDKLIKSWQPDLPGTIWHSMGYPIIGYGKAAYQAGGREQEWFIVGLAAHKSYFSLYVWGIWQGGRLLEAYGDRLGRVKTGKACLNFKTIADLNLTEIRAVIDKAVALQTTVPDSCNT